MQIGRHYTLTTYIAVRLAGYAHNPASIIAYSAQYVDDATNSGAIHYDNGATPGSPGKDKMKKYDLIKSIKGNSGEERQEK